MMKILYFYLSGLLLLWSSCQRPTMLDFALRYAGENRVELEKVLDHYRNDSLKYRAAVFLIGNMPYHYFYTGAQLDSLRQGYRWMQRTGLSAKAVKHKLWKTFGEPDVRSIGGEPPYATIPETGLHLVFDRSSGAFSQNTNKVGSDVKLYCNKITISNGTRTITITTVGRTGKILKN